MNGYELSKNWFDFSFENPEKIRPIHTAIYFFAIDHCNRLGWKEKFGFPTMMAMEALGIKKWHTYAKALYDLVDWGFIELIEKSKNQYSSNIISINSAMPKKGEALGKATAKHRAKQGQSTGRSKVDINKLSNYKTNEQKNTKENLSKLRLNSSYFASDEIFEMFCDWVEVYETKHGNLHEIAIKQHIKDLNTIASIEHIKQALADAIKGQYKNIKYYASKEETENVSSRILWL